MMTLTKGGVELKPHLAMTVRGTWRDEQQWQIFWHGRLIGYLPYAPGSQILPVYRFPYAEVQAVVAGCEAERERLEKPGKVRKPMETLKAVEEILDAQLLEEKEDDESE
jgi:hypothetical protein